MNKEIIVGAVQMESRLKDKEVEEILYDTTFVIDEKGELVGKYRKLHLYPTENVYFKRGISFPVFTVKGVHRLG